MTYTVKQLKYYFDLEDWELAMFHRGAAALGLLYGEKDPQQFPIEGVMRHGIVFMCYRDGNPCGFLIASKNRYLFDPRKTMLRQETFFAEPGTRAAWYLFNEFLDFGKRNANYIVTMIGKHTNLTPRTLERLGFEELETLYRMEI